MASKSAFYLESAQKCPLPYISYFREGGGKRFRVCLIVDSELVVVGLRSNGHDRFFFPQLLHHLLWRAQLTQRFDFVATHAPFFFYEGHAPSTRAGEWDESARLHSNLPGFNTDMESQVFK
jgi:hypothetical protein